jgi:hypothetical protein
LFVLYLPGAELTLVRVHGVPRNAGRRMPMRDGFRLEVVVAS